MDPIEQFAVITIVPLHIFGIDVSFTNASVFMLCIVAAIMAFVYGATRKGSLIPGRLQSAAEMSYEFVANTVHLTSGSKGMDFFPLIFSIFMFVLVCNIVTLVPYSFSVTSQIIVTAALSILVIGLVIGIGVFRHGFGFLRAFVPSGVPMYLLPFIVMIEIISFATRPVSLSVRLFANMLAGEIALKVMGGFVAALLGAGVAAIIAPLPLIATIALFAFELLEAVLQAYVFAILTCVYLNDAIHPGH
ncbi:MAG: F0F1 ATP synthase subunit A [Beijerinckiaceae bacterium]|nr:MAG: F0F1 ATP synthase subunit A [Beijerinckiaceae bacterium]